ncbi:MAG: tetratricopeptide repeat protein [Bdellovibrionia bacterium]
MIKQPVTRFLVLLAGVVLGLVMTSCGTANKDEEKAELHLRIGTAYLNQGNYPLALKELLEAYKLNSSNPIVNNNLALAYFVRGKYEDAEKYLLRATSLDSKYTDAYNHLGRVHIEMGKTDEAITELNKVVADLTYPQPERALANLGLAHFKTKNYPLAEKRLKEALKANNTFCPAHNYYGQTLYYMKEYKRAAQAVDAAVQVCRDLDETYYIGALSYFRIGQKEKGQARMREIIELFPKSKYVPKARAHLTDDIQEGKDSE